MLQNTHKKKVGFIIHNNGFTNVDLSIVDKYNPGIGGSEYQLFLQLKMLGTLYSEEFDLHCFLDDINGSFFDGPVYHCIKDISNIFLDVLVIKDKEYASFSKMSCKKVVVCHNAPSSQLITDLIRDKTTSIVFLTKSERSPFFSLSNIKMLFKSYICPNIIYPVDYYCRRGYSNKRVVAFIGAVKPAKSFDVVAKIWPSILSLQPNCELWVFGSGSLYDRNKKLGNYSIAEPEYEKRIVELMGYSAFSKVKWFGNLSGYELNMYLDNVDVGIVNPKGLGETFCLSIFDFIKHGIPILLNKNTPVYSEVAGKCGLYYSSFEEIPTVITNYFHNKQKIPDSCYKKQLRKYNGEKTIYRFTRIIKRASK